MQRDLVVKGRDGTSMPTRSWCGHRSRVFQRLLTRSCGWTRLVRRVFVGSAQRREHRKVADVERDQLEPELLSGRSDDEVGRRQPRMTAAPSSSQLARASSDRLVDARPSERPEEPFGASPFLATEAPHDLDPRDLGACRRFGQASAIPDRSGMPAQDVDDH